MSNWLSGLAYGPQPLSRHTRYHKLSQKRPRTSRLEEYKKDKTQQARLKDMHARGAQKHPFSAAYSPQPLLPHPSYPILCQIEPLLEHMIDSTEQHGLTKKKTRAQVNAGHSTGMQKIPSVAYGPQPHLLHPQL